MANSPNLKMAIIADDLTGALDAAAPFAGRGLRTLVAVASDEIGEALRRDPEILAVNTASREIDAHTACARVSEVLSRLPCSARLFKKVDSRLKGNVATELLAFCTSDLAVLPAIPEFGRIVRDGAISGFGVEEPVAISFLLANWPSPYIPDVTSVAEMEKAYRKAPRDALLVGARGLADVAAHDLSGGKPNHPAALPQGNIGFVIGSRDPITLGQIEALRQTYPDMPVMRAPNGVAPPDSIDEGASCVSLLFATPEPARVSEDWAAGALAASLRRTGMEKRTSLLISGGATAQTVLKALGTCVLDVSGEVLEGLPVSYTSNRAIITKSGGFGSTDALVAIARAATGEGKEGQPCTRHSS